MRRLALVFALVVLPVLRAQAQEVDPPEGVSIAQVQMSGLELSRLSPGLQEDIGKLPGTPLNRQQLRAMATRIESEQPRYVVGVRAVQDSEGNARVVFVAARARDQDRDANVNTRYVVDKVEIRGLSEREIAQPLLDELHALAGKQLDTDEAERLATRLRDAFPEHSVQRHIERGHQPGRITLVYFVRRLESSRWLHLEPLDLEALYHSDQGWGANLPLVISNRDVEVTPIFAIDNGDDLIEEFSGFGLRVESRRLGTERLGAFFEWSTYDQTWRDSTLATLAVTPGIPEPYRNRMNVTPLLKFAFTSHVSVAGGVSITELDPLVEIGNSSMANAGIGIVRFSQRWRPGSGPRHAVEADFSVHAGTRTLESDLTYERYLGQATYWARWPRHTLIVSGKAGRINLDAPLFERFSLGDSQTLRGWNKYDIAPAGGDRMFYASMEYRYRGLAMFLDSGSVGDAGRQQRIRFSAGLGYNPGPVFFTLGFPLNTEEFRAVFTMGVRISRVGFSKD